MTPADILSALQSGDLGDRLSAVNQIRNLPPSEGYELIKQAVSDGNSRVRYAAVSQLASLGQQNPAECLEILRDRLFKDSETDVQAAAADAIGALKLTEGFPDLAQRYQESEDWLLRMSIVATLGELGDLRALDLLKEALNSPEILIQAAAVSALGELRQPETASWIEPFATHEDWQVRFRVAQALATLNTPDTAATLEKLKTDPIAQVAEVASRAPAT